MRTVSSELSAVFAISFVTVDSAIAKVVMLATVATMTAGCMVSMGSLSMTVVSFVVSLEVAKMSLVVSMVSLSMTVVTTVSDVATVVTVMTVPRSGGNHGESSQSGDSEHFVLV